MKILVAVDGSRFSLDAVQCLTRLASAKKKLDSAGIPYAASVLVGPVAESIVKHAKAARCDLIYIGTRGMTEIGNAMLGSTATKVLHMSDTPVLLVK